MGVESGKPGSLYMQEVAAGCIRILQALKPGGHVLLTMKQGKGTSTATDGRVFVLWQDLDLREVFAKLNLTVVEAFTNASALGTGETWLGYVLGMTRQAIHE